MRRGAALAALALVLALPASAAGQGQSVPGAAIPERITILAVFKTIDFGEPSFISGRMRFVEPSTRELFPYTFHPLTLVAAPIGSAGFTPLASDATEAEGFYSFPVQPQVHTRYQVLSADPALGSEAKLVRVRFVLDFDVASERPPEGRATDVTGTVQPARAGVPVAIETRTKDEDAKRRFRRADTTTTAADGTFTGQVRVRQDSEVRAIALGDPLNLPSKPRKPVELRPR